ncbi:hypothetical protein K474DRAFT_1641003 [Panus rudis PR-1116 ss-1]|nr:hypothetical protein K474DRAFT_1641003 [Panus rudis PR-1116 ss-1]
MNPYSATSERLADLNHSTSPYSSPERNANRYSSPVPFPPLSREGTQMSTLSSYSTTNLVEHSESGKKRGSRLFSWNWHKEHPNDTEKNGGDDTQRARAKSMKPWEGWRLIFFGSWLNFLILLIPASWILKVTAEEQHTLIFISCILAMIPLVKLHDIATRELSIRLGGTKTGLLNASMSNIVEMVVAIIALRKCELRVVQSSLIGSMLSKLLLILGMCFFAGGLRFTEQDFDTTATQIHSSLLSISVGAVLLPAAFHFALTYTSNDDPVAAATSIAEQKQDILRMSHGVAIVLLFIYISYLVFQFWSHSHLYKDSAKASTRLPNSVSTRSLAAKIPVPGRKSPSSKSALSPNGKLGASISTDSLASSEYDSPPQKRGPYMYQKHSFSDDSLNTAPMQNSNTYLISPFATTSQVTNSNGGSHIEPSPPPPAAGSTVRLVSSTGEESEVELMRRRRPPVRPTTGDSSSVDVSPVEEVVSFYHYEEIPIGRTYTQDMKGEPGEQAEAKKETPREPQMSWPLTLFLLTVVTVLVALNAEWLVDSMDGLSPTISKEWIGLILLPAVGSLAECITSVNVSVKDQLTLSISVAVGSTIQTALFVIPFMVVLGWIMDKPLALLFDPFESVVLYISVHTMGYVVADGRSNWLEGVILVCLYIVIAVSFWFYPGSNFSSTLAVCSTSV